jgi:hypothetical protein
MQAIDIRPEWGAEKKGKRHFFFFSGDGGGA